jgi:hypothetical protein
MDLDSASFHLARPRARLPVGDAHTILVQVEIEDRERADVCSGAGR